MQCCRGEGTEKKCTESSNISLKRSRQLAKLNSSGRPLTLTGKKLSFSPPIVLNVLLLPTTVNEAFWVTTDFLAAASTRFEERHFAAMMKDMVEDLRDEFGMQIKQNMTIVQKNLKNFCKKKIKKASMTPSPTTPTPPPATVTKLVPSVPAVPTTTVSVPHQPAVPTTTMSVPHQLAVPKTMSVPYQPAVPRTMSLPPTSEASAVHTKTPTFDTPYTHMRTMPSPRTFGDLIQPVVRRRLWPDTPTLYADLRSMSRDQMMWDEENRTPVRYPPTKRGRYEGYTSFQHTMNR